MSNTETANLANAKLALGLTTDDLPPAKGSENPDSMEELVTEVSMSAPESASVMEFATTPSNRDTTGQRLAESSSRYMKTVREIRLEGQSRSPVFIPEFSSASPWANMAPDKSMNGEPFTENASVARNSSLSEAMPSPIFPRTAVAQPVSHSVTEVIERPTVKAEAVRPGNGTDRLPVPEPPPNFSRSIASQPANPRVQPFVTGEAIPGSDRHSPSPVAERRPSSLPTFSSGESILVAMGETTQSDRPPQGSAKDLLPIGEAESVTPSNSSQAIAAVQPPDASQQRITQTRNDIYRPNPQDVQLIQEQVQELEENAVVEELIEGSPSLTIFNPTGYGADNNTGYLSATYQSRTRFVENDDGALAIGFGFGDARDAVGVEVSYTLASVFGENRDAGTGGFNVKIHKQFANDWAVAAGWNGVVFIGEDDGVEDSIYGTVTKVIRTQESISSPFSRIALTAGVGNGQFRTEEALENGDDSVNLFGSAAVRVAKPVSVIAEWTGQDLAVGASIAPFKNIPFVITPAVRDITGAGDGARFVLGAGVGFRF
jgi:hypothetical protein